MTWHTIKNSQNCILLSCTLHSFEDIQMQKLDKSVITTWHKNQNIQPKNVDFRCYTYAPMHLSPIHFILYRNQLFLPILNIHKLSLADPDILGSDDGGETKFTFFESFFNVPILLTPSPSSIFQNSSQILRRRRTTLKNHWSRFLVQVDVILILFICVLEPPYETGVPNEVRLRFFNLSL